MSIWISKPYALIAACLLALAGCFETDALRQAGHGQSQGGPSSASVLGGALVVAGPGGYCIDDTATREGDNQAFVLLVRCEASARPTPVLGATVTGLAAPGSDTPESLAQLADFVRSPTGRATLARSGRAGDVTLHDVRVRQGAVWVSMSDSGNPAAFDPDYWRAILPLSDRMVTLSVLSARAHPVDGERMLGILQDFVEAMRRANGG